MANEYSGDPSESDKDTVRFLLSDTSAPWNFSDEEINWSLEEYGSPYSAAAELAVVMSGKFADKMDKTVGPLSIDYGSMAERWRTLANSIRKRSNENSGAKVLLTQNSKSPHVRLGMHDIQTLTQTERLAGREIGR